MESSVAPAVKKPRKKKPKEPRPLRRKKWLGEGKPRKPIRQVNPEATAKRLKKYKAGLSSSHARAQRKRILERAAGHCECGCGQPFTLEDPMQRAHLSYRHFGYESDDEVGAWRRSCNLRERAERKSFQRIK